MYTGYALESNSISLFVLQVFAEDLDGGANGQIVYNITNGDDDGVFAIQNDGRIITKKAIDREKIQSFNLTVCIIIFFVLQ